MTNYRRLTPVQRALLIMLLRNGQATVTELAKASGITRQSLQQLARNYGLWDIPVRRQDYVNKLWKETLDNGERTVIELGLFQLGGASGRSA